MSDNKENQGLCKYIGTGKEFNLGFAFACFY